MPLDLAVIESRWWTDRNSSVRGLFDLLADIRKDNPSAYHYEMFNNSASLKEIVLRTAGKRYLYIAAHANDDYIEGAESKPENRISRRQFRIILRNPSVLGRNRLRGLFVGSCLFVNEGNARFLLRNSNNNNAQIKWIAGYSKRIDFIDSSVVDLYFWNAYYEALDHNPNLTPFRQLTRLSRISVVLCRARMKNWVSTSSSEHKDEVEV